MTGGSNGPGLMVRTGLAGARSLWDRFLFYTMLMTFGAMSLSWSLASLVLLQVLPSRTASALGPVLAMAFSRLYLKLVRATGFFTCNVEALDGLRDDQALVIAANHPSLLDAVLVTSRLPRVACIAKAELWDNPLLGSGMRLAGYIRNDAPIALVKLAVARLREGRQLLLFPEGTRTARWPVSPFKGGFATMAKLAAVPVQTVLIETNTPFLGKGWPLLKMPTLPLAYRARLGRRFEVQGDVRSFVSALERYFQEELQGQVALR